MTPVERRMMKAVQQALTPDLLKGRWAAASSTCDVKGHCYAASEALYHLLGGKATGYTPMSARDDAGGTHWWLRGPTGILDPTAAQYLPGKPPYARGRGRGFQTVKPSRRAAEIIRRVQRRPNPTKSPTADDTLAALLPMELTEYGSTFRTGSPVCFTYARNKQKSPNYGPRFQQDIEPAGAYMISLPPDQPVHGADWVKGQKCFRNPLVLRFTTDSEQLYGPGSWKARLRDVFRKTGKRLSAHLLKLGYDGIVTVWVQEHSRKGATPSHVKEIVDLTPVGKARIPNPSPVPLDTIDMDGIVEALSEAAVQKAKLKTPEQLHEQHIGSLNDETLDIKGRRQPFVVQAWFYNAPSSEQHVIGGDAGSYEGGIVVNLHVNAKDGPRIRTAYKLGYLQADMKRVLMHELTHVRLHRTIAKQRRYKPLPLGVPMSYSQALTYYNDPVEVPAFTQQIVAEAKAEAKRLRGKVGERLLLDSAIEASWTWQEMSKYLFTENRNHILKAVARAIESERLPNPSPIPLDKNRVLALAQALEDWLAKHLTGKGPLGERLLVPGVPYDLTSVSGKPIDVLVRLRSVKTASPYYAVSGGTGSDKHGQTFVIVDINGSIPQERIQLPAKMKAGVASQIYPVLLHELTHAADTYAKGLGARGQQGGAAYYNDPAEVRAYMQEVVDEVQQHRPDSRARLAEAFGAGKGMTYLVRLSTTWREIEPHLTEKNKRKIILAVVKAMETR